MQTPKQVGGFLVTMFDTVADEAEFDAWFDNEHIPERLACPGFLRVRRYRSTEGSPRYLNIYELESLEALQSPEYLSLSEKSSDLTKAMRASFRGLVRNVYLEMDWANQRGQ